MNGWKTGLRQNVSRSVQLLTFALCLGAANVAAAHGTYPGATRIAFDPEQPGRMVAATNLGLLVSADRGATWKWSCIAAYRADTLDDPVFAIGKASALVLGHSGGVVSSGDTCGFAAATSGLEPIPVLDVGYDGKADRFWTIASKLASSAAYASDDGGASWKVVHALPEGLFLRSLRVAPSDGNTVYLSATRASSSYAATPGGESIVYRTRDGGTTWESFPFALGATEYDLYVIGVDPSDPERVFARTSTSGVERILLSEDGGKSFAPVLSGEGPFLAFTMVGTRAYAGSDRSGLFRSEDRGRTFQALKPDLPIHCLAEHEGALYMCPGYARADYEIGISRDHGETFQPLLEFKQFTGEVVCGAGSELDQLCSAELPVARRALEMLEIARNPVVQPTFEEDASETQPTALEEDAGVSAPAPMRAKNPPVPGSCGVNGGTDTGQSNYSLLAAALLTVLMMTRRRRAGNGRAADGSLSGEGNEHA